MATPAPASTDAATSQNRLLIRAAEEGRADAIEDLLTNGADLHARDDGGNTALHLASYQVCGQVLSLLDFHLRKF